MNTIRCRICGSKKKKLVRNHLRYGVQRNVYQCGTCSLIYLAPKKEGVFYESSEYRKKYGPVLGKAAKAKHIFETYRPFQYPIVKELRGVLRKNMSVLDVGCSAGQFLDALKGRVRSRVGLELSSDAVAFIKKNLDFPVYSDPIEVADITEGPFDLITCLQTLEHVDQPVEFLKHLKKNLKKDGYLYLELPNLDDVMISEYRVPGYEDFYYHEPHLSYFTKKTLARALQKAGFKGKIWSVQRYSLFNHIHWIQSNAPQGSFLLGNTTPQLVEKPKGKAGKALNAFIEKTDREYKTLVNKLGLGESLVFLGKQIQ